MTLKISQLNRTILFVALVTVVFVLYKSLVNYPMKAQVYLCANSILLLLFFLRKRIRPFLERFHFQTTMITLAIGVFLRWFWYYFSNATQTSDAGYYMETGKKILMGENFLSLSKQTGPSWLAAIGMFIFGETNRGATFMMFFCSCLFLVIVYLLAKKIFNPIAAFFCVFLATVWPENIFYSNLISNSLPLGVFCLLGMLFLILSDNKKYSLFYMVAAGFFMGIAQYMRGTVLLMLLACFLYLLLTKEFRKIIIVGLGFFIATLPLLTFNYTQGGVFSFSPSQYSGFSLVIGTNIEKNGQYYEGFDIEIQNHAQKMKDQGILDFKSLDMVTMNKAATHLAKQNILTRPTEFFALAFGHKLPLFLNTSANLSWSTELTDFKLSTSEMNNLAEHTERYQRIIFYFLVFSLFLLFVESLNRPTTNELCLLIVSFAAVMLAHMLAEVQSQYHLSMAGFYPLLAGYVLYKTVQIDTFRRIISKKS